MLTIRCILLTTNVVISIGLELHTNFELDPQFADKLCTVEHVEFERTTRSVLQCVWLCKTSYGSGCNSVIYYNVTKTCHGLKTAIPCATWTDFSGARFYGPAGAASTTTSTTDSTTTGCTTSDPLVAGVADAQLTANDIYSDNYQPHYGRLDYAGNWAAKTDTVDHYIQVDFLSIKVITTVITQGSFGYAEWVTSYKVLISTNCTVFSAVADQGGSDQIFLGNADQSTHVSHTLDTPVLAQCVRINPQTSSAWPALRFELLGCTW